MTLYEQYGDIFITFDYMATIGLLELGRVLWLCETQEWLELECGIEILYQQFWVSYPLK